MLTNISWLGNRRCIRHTAPWLCSQSLGLSTTHPVVLWTIGFAVINGQHPAVTIPNFGPLHGQRHGPGRRSAYPDGHIYAAPEPLTHGMIHGVLVFGDESADERLGKLQQMLAQYVCRVCHLDGSRAPWRMSVWCASLRRSWNLWITHIGGPVLLLLSRPAVLPRTTCLR